MIQCLQSLGKPYDTLDEVIGIRENPSSLKAFGVNYRQIDLVNNEFDEEKIIKELKENTIKLIHIQRSIGYSSRNSISIDMLEKIIKKIREIDENVIIFIDNCYTEFVERKSPLEVRCRYNCGLSYQKFRWRHCTKPELMYVVKQNMFLL